MGKNVIISQYIDGAYEEIYPKTSLEQLEINAGSGISINGNTISADGGAKIKTGTYIGTGYGASKTVNLGFKPKAVLIMKGGYGTYHSNYIMGGIIITDKSNDVGSITDNGFSVRPDINSLNSEYYYIVFY